jgi:hypothetical protein
MSAFHSPVEGSLVKGCQTCDGRGFTHFKHEGGYDDCAECQGMGLVILNRQTESVPAFRKALRRLSRFLTVDRH